MLGKQVLKNAENFLKKLEEQAPCLQNDEIILATLTLLCGQFCERYHPRPGVGVGWDDEQLKYVYYAVPSPVGHGTVIDYGLGPGVVWVEEISREQAVKRIAKIFKEYWLNVNFASWDDWYVKIVKVKDGIIVNE